MSNYPFSVIILRSLEEFDIHAESWNDLWNRSTCSNPTARAETLSLFCKSKKKKQKFITVIIQDEKKKWVAAIPLIEEIRFKVIRCAVSPRLISACLLVDPEVDVVAVIRLLIHEIRNNMPYHWICAESVRLESFEWALFISILSEFRIDHASVRTHRVSLISLDGQVEDLLKKWNQEKIKDVRRLLRKISKIGKLEFVEDTSSYDVLGNLQTCFDIENLGWKGNDDKKGMSIIKRDQVSYFTQNAILLTQCNNMYLFRLVLNGQLVAFQYNFGAKNTIYCNKIGYNPEFKKYSPGFLLHLLVFEYLIRNRTQFKVFDYVGEFKEYQVHWNPKFDLAGFIIFPTSSFIGRIFFKMYSYFRQI